jgi:hypothetical protein
MRAAMMWMGIATLGIGGCSATARSAARLSDFADAEVSPLRVVASRAVDSRIRPMVPVHLAAEGSAVAITFGERGRRQVVARLDPASLDQLSSEMSEHSEAAAAPIAGPARVELDDGHFVECWTHESSDGGRDVFAQLWTAGGSRLGAPLVISSPDSDVLGAPHAATTDGHHVIVTFAATAGDSFELRAVSLEDSDASASSDPVARR